jgi:hypothetical protein
MVLELLSSSPGVWVPPVLVGVLWQGFLCVLTVPAASLIYSCVRRGNCGIIAAVPEIALAQHLAVGTSPPHACVLMHLFFSTSYSCPHASFSQSFLTSRTRAPVPLVTLLAHPGPPGLLA